MFVCVFFFFFLSLLFLYLSIEPKTYARNLRNGRIQYNYTATTTSLEVVAAAAAKQYIYYQCLLKLPLQQIAWILGSIFILSLFFQSGLRWCLARLPDRSDGDLWPRNALESPQQAGSSRSGWQADSTIYGFTLLTLLSEDVREKLDLSHRVKQINLQIYCICSILPKTFLGPNQYQRERERERKKLLWSLSRILFFFLLVFSKKNHYHWPNLNLSSDPAAALLRLYKRENIPFFSFFFSSYKIILPR